MSLGTFLMALPHFIIDRYKFESSVRSSVNSTNSFIPCMTISSWMLSEGDHTSTVSDKGCEHESRLSMWIYVLLGNVLRGIGETPVQPLGISYIDDHAPEDSAAFYIGCIQTVSVIGPVFGYLLGSLCAKIYVDIGFVNMENVDITPGDPRWVGAWWLGYLITGLISLMSAGPFWFLPRSLPEGRMAKFSPEGTSCTGGSTVLDHNYQADDTASFIEMAKDFLPTLRSLLGNPVYFLYLCVSVVQFNSLIGMVTYKPKYIEQHYGQSAARANFLMGVMNIPAVAVGMFLGGVLMKKLRLSIMGAARLALGTSLLGYFLSLLFFALGCENPRVAGITVTYAGIEGLSYEENPLSVNCNKNCECSPRDWDPVCGEDGLTYVSPCLAGCRTSHGSGIDTVFEQCTCVTNGNQTAYAGQCQQHRQSCQQVLPYFLALSVITSFIISLGGTPGYMLLIRCIKPQLKSLALGFHTLTTRTLAGIPAPIYFGAIIDTTCLKWGHKRCGGKGACRIYNTTSYRTAYLGLTLGLRTGSFFLCALGLLVLRQHVLKEESGLASSSNTGSALAELQAYRAEDTNNSHSDQSPRISDQSPWISDQSPHILDQSPQISDQSPHISDQSPRISDQSPRILDYDTERETRL
ncbi:solute carrier organic anion transporter family member 1C1 isoform X2 [Brachyhypopomus gauderio]